jgi:hypothetical protein
MRAEYTPRFALGALRVLRVNLFFLCVLCVFAPLRELF